MGVDDNIVSLAGALGILILGFVFSQLIAGFFLRVYRTRNKIVKMEVDKKVKSVKYFLMSLTVIIALYVLKQDVIEGLIITTLSVLPNILTTILLVILGIVLVNFIITGLEIILAGIGFLDLVSGLGQKQTLKIVLAVSKIFLYLIVFETVLSFVGIFSETVTAAIRLILVGIVGVVILLAFLVLRIHLENLMAGYYLKSKNYFKTGQRVKLQQETGEIREITATDTTILTDSGYFRIIPNKELLKMNLEYQKGREDLRSLEEIKNHFVEQKPSHCGPAAAQMALSIFGIKEITQAKIAKASGTVVGKGTHPDTLIKTISKLTKGKIAGHWIKADEIRNLKTELKSWLGDSALIIADFKRAPVFPTTDTTKAHYALVVGIEGDDLLILDPSKARGGVYLVNYENLYKGMKTYSELIQGPRGYIVLAVRGTSAFHRLKQGFYFADRSLYLKLSKDMKKKFDKEVKKPLYKKVMPEPFEKYLNEWNERYKIARLWRPS